VLCGGAFSGSDVLVLGLRMWLGVSAVPKLDDCYFSWHPLSAFLYAAG
jgi:hypothetical protein